MANKEIQEERIRGYFIQATKELLRSEGLKVVSVRNIADRAGYSYATLYNYFRDVKELVFICVKDFQEECGEIIAKETLNTDEGIPKIKAVMRSYVKYFIQYPGIFELFFLEKMNDLGARQRTNEMIFTFPERLCESDWQYCLANSIFNEKQIKDKQDDIKYAVTSLLLFYLNRRIPDSYSEFERIVEEKLDIILDNK